MPTFSAITLDRLLEPGASGSAAPRPKPKPLPVPTSNSDHQRRSSNLVNAGSSRKGSNSSTEKRFHWAQISPALYATPESTPLPDSPSSFPPSPYIVNHKRRGPRLSKSASQEIVPEKSLADDELEGGQEKKGALATATSLPVLPIVPSPVEEEEHVNGMHCEEVGSSSDVANGGVGGGEELAQFLEAASPEGKSESTDYYTCQESMSHASSIDVEDNGGMVERSLHMSTPMAEFYDAWEELSSDSGAHGSVRDWEAEVREIRLSLLMELEKRKQAEETVDNMRNRWRRIARHFSDVGLTISSDPVILEKDGQDDATFSEDLCRQVYLARLVSESVGRGTAKAEAEIEMEAKLEVKNFEIARLMDRLHFYEAVNREMTQRNQETIEMARRDRQRRKQRQRWYWGFIAAAFTIGTGALVWSYLPSREETASASDSQGQAENDLDH